MIVSRYTDATDKLESAFVGVLPSGKRRKPPTQAEWTTALERFNAEARLIRNQFHLGMIGRAVVAYRLQQRLMASGYPADVVRQLLFSMVLSAFVG